MVLLHILNYCLHHYHKTAVGRVYVHMHVNQYEKKAVIFTFISLKQDLNIVYIEVIAVPGLSLVSCWYNTWKRISYKQQQQKKSNDSLF